MLNTVLFDMVAAGLQRFQRFQNVALPISEGAHTILGMTICASNLKLCGLLLYFSRLNTKRRSVVWEAE